MKDALSMRVLRYLQDHNVATLATCDSGNPWSAALYYASDEYILYFLSSPTSRHCRDLDQNPHVAVTIQEDYSDWLEIKGIQIEGIASEISGIEEEKARRLYGQKFPVVGMLSRAPSAVVKALAKVSWYKIVPQRLYFIDNSLGLGNRDEINLPRNRYPEGL